jgi:rubrerythrin
MDHYISREKTIEAIKTDLSQFVYDEYGNMTALGVRLIHRIGNITGCEPFGNLIDRDELVKDIEGQTERGGRTSSDVIAKGVLEVFLDYIRNFPSARPVNEKTGKWHVEGFNVWCTSCGFHPKAIEAFDYCPRCGAKMEVEQ